MTLNGVMTADSFYLCSRWASCFTWKATCRKSFKALRAERWWSATFSPPQICCSLVLPS